MAASCASRLGEDNQAHRHDPSHDHRVGDRQPSEFVQHRHRRLRQSVLRLGRERLHLRHFLLDPRRPAAPRRSALALTPARRRLPPSRGPRQSKRRSKGASTASQFLAFVSSLIRSCSQHGFWPWRLLRVDGLGDRFNQRLAVHGFEEDPEQPARSASSRTPGASCAVTKIIGMGSPACAAVAAIPGPSMPPS